MSAPAPAADLLDLKLLPAWVKEPAAPNEYAEFAGEDAEAQPRREGRPSDRRRGSARPLAESRETNENIGASVMVKETGKSVGQRQLCLR